MTTIDKIYKEVIESVLVNGKWDKDTPVRTVWADGTPAYTKSILNAQMKFDNGKNEGLLTTKRVPTKDPIKELFWIWKYKSNSVKFLREKLGCNVWNEWEREDGTVGRSYGWQLANKFRKVKYTKELQEMYSNGEIRNTIPWNRGHVGLDQVDWLIYTLKTNPYSRRIKTTLWCVEDLDDMALEPCVYETHWQIWDGKLNLTVNIRSNDMGIGNPYNIFQYSILHRLIAQVTGHEVGEICFNIDNAHIYERHIDVLQDQIKNEPFNSPIVTINPNVKSFYDFTLDDIKVENYNHHGNLRMEIAI